MTVPRFWREIPQRYNLKASRCTVCEAIHFPPRVVCPTCRRQSIGKMEALNLRGRGRVVEWTRIHRPAPGYEKHTPYLLALIQTDDGPLLTGQVVDTVEDLAPGMPVRSVFRRLGEDGAAGVIHYGTKWTVDVPAEAPTTGAEEEE